MIRLEINDTKMVIQVRNVRSKDRISSDKLSNRRKLNNMRECLQDKLQQFGHLERMQGLLGLANVEFQKLVAVSPEKDPLKQGMR